MKAVAFMVADAKLIAYCIANCLINRQTDAFRMPHFFIVDFSILCRRKVYRGDHMIIYDSIMLLDIEIS